MDNTPGSDSSGPKIIRPIPRRPFRLNFSSPTPPEDEDEDCSSPKPQISASDLRFLAPHQNSAAPSGESSTPLSHTTSYLNLTAPALFGIYSPSTTNPFFSKDEDDQGQSQFVADRNDVLLAGTDTPIDPPAPRPGLDEKTYQLMRKRASSFSHPFHTREGATSTTTSPQRNRWETAAQLALRAALLFVLGMGYGVLVTRLPPQHSGHPLAATYESHSDWRYLAFWGAAGVALGSLLPWFDRVWEETITTGQRNASALTPGNRVGAVPRTEAALGRGQQPGIAAPVMEKPSVAAAPQVDWALVVRGIGVFVGIVFAIRKLAWTSTMQLSLTLALANPILWYLIDRSKPGFLLSAAVGLAGSLAVVLMGLSPGATPPPGPAPDGSSSSSTTSGRSWLDVTAANGTAAGSGNGPVSGCTDSSQGGCAAAAAARCGFASQETIETSIWMLSVLFCSCVCFGNIGRRLALNSSAAGRGRWGGVR